MTGDHFSKLTPGLQLFWDAHSLSNFAECPRRYQYRILEGWASRLTALDLDFGLRYHAALEAADRARFAGADLDQQLVVATEDVFNAPDFTEPNEAKNRFTLLRSVVWNLDFYKNASIMPVEMDGRPAVELHFRFGIDLETDDGKESFGLCGYMDQVGKMPDGFVRPIERKTTKSSLTTEYFKRFTPNMQLSVYNLASKIAFEMESPSVVVEACQTAVNFSGFERREVRRTPGQLQEFIREVKYYIKMAEQMAKANYWPKNETACMLCQFKDICGKDPAVRKIWLEQSGAFIKRPWNPLEVR